MESDGCSVIILTFTLEYLGLFRVNCNPLIMSLRHCLQGRELGSALVYVKLFWIYKHTDILTTLTKISVLAVVFVNVGGHFEMQIWVLKTKIEHWGQVIEISTPILS